MKLFTFFSPKWVHENLLRLWGGGSGGGGSSTQTVQNFSPAEAAQRARVQREAGEIYSNTKAGAEGPYPGAQVVPFSSDTYTAQNLMRGAANTQASQTLPQLAAATQFGLGDVLDVNSNPYLQAAMDASNRQITQSYTDPNGVMSQIRTSSMLNGGQGNSTRQGIAEGVAAGRYAQAIGDNSARIASEGYGQGLDTFAKTLGLTPQTMAAYNMPAQAYGAVGAQNEAMAQAQENYAAAGRDWDLNSSWVPLQNYANIVYGGTQPSGSTTTSQMDAQRSNPLMGAAGGAMAGAQLGSIVPGIGTGIGAIGGAILGGLFS